MAEGTSSRLGHTSRAGLQGKTVLCAAGADRYNPRMQNNPNQWQQPPQPPGWGPPGQPAGAPPYAPVVPTPPASSDVSVSAVTAIKFLFQDPDWKSTIVIASVYSLIPVLGQIALVGWHAEIMQRLARRHPRPIPKLDFSDLMHYFGRGISPFVVALLMTIPLSVIVTVLATGGILGATALAATTNEPALMILVLVVVGLVTFVASAAMSVLFLAAQTRADLTEDIGAAISPGAILAYARKIWVPALVASLLYALLAIPVMLLGYAACVVGAYPALAIISTGSVSLRWQIYCRYLSLGGEPIAVKAPVQVPSEAQAQAQAQRPAPYVR
jgi:hypothetical protein